MRYDLAVVGGGPAGLSAAVTAAERGARVCVLDEGMEPGGRLPAQLHAVPGRPGQWRVGYQEAQALIHAASRAGVEIRSGTSVWGLFPGYQLVTTRAAGSGGAGSRADAGELEAACVLLATGAVPQAPPVPGWTLPGVMTAGAAQILVNVHRVRPGRRAVIVGVDPLGLAAAQHLHLAGVDVAGIVLPPQGPAISAGQRPAAVMETLLRLSAGAPTALLKLAGQAVRFGGVGLAARLYPRKGIRVWGAPLLLRSGVTRICGESQVEGVELAELSPDGTVVGSSREFVPADLVVLAGGLAPLVELAGAAGCELACLPELGGCVPLHGPTLETALPGLFVAGSASGVEGAAVAMAQGRLAGLAVAERLGLLSGGQARPLLTEARANVVSARERAHVQFHADVAGGRRRLERLWAESADRRGVHVSAE